MEEEREGIRGRRRADEARRELERETGLEEGNRGVRVGEGWLVMELAVEGVLLGLVSSLGDDDATPPAPSVLSSTKDDRPLPFSPSGLKPDPAPAG